MDRIMAKLDNTTLTAISFGNFVKNAELLRRKRVIESVRQAIKRQMSRFRKRPVGDTTAALAKT
jgi:hypothetical protein